MFQVAHTLAVAEQAIGFEHRDLHWGNVLVKEVKGDKQCEYKLDGDIFKVHTIEKSVLCTSSILLGIKNISHGDLCQGGI